jgi:hypothetical protein
MMNLRTTKVVEVVDMVGEMARAHERELFE